MQYFNILKDLFECFEECCQCFTSLDLGQIGVKYSKCQKPKIKHSDEV